MDKTILSDIFFHSNWETQWQGRVVGPVSESGNYWLVQTFSWVDGSESTLQVVSVHTLSEWTFYSSSAAMDRFIDQAKARWVKEEAEYRGDQ